MATAADATIPLPQQAAFLSQEQLQTQHPQQQASSALPQYPEMIMSAIEALNEAAGSNKSAISRQIEATHPDLPAAHTTLLSHHLNKMKQSGQLVLVKNNYMKPDPNAPPKRGRGRPPKPKAPLLPDTMISPPRPRGRPPKPKDPFAPVAEPKTTSTPGTGKPRGRPPKKAKTAVGPASASTVVKRGRGRPPKVQPEVAPIAG